MVAFVDPMLFVATHWYKPLSTGLKFMIVRFPSFTSVFPTGKGETSLIQVSLGGGYPSVWQVSCIVADSIFETSDEGFLVKIGRPKRRKINMMWPEKAIVYLFLPVFQTTQNRRLSLEKKYLCEFSRVPSTHHKCKSWKWHSSGATRTNNGTINDSSLVSRLARVWQDELKYHIKGARILVVLFGLVNWRFRYHPVCLERNVKTFIYTGCSSGWCMKKYC